MKIRFTKRSKELSDRAYVRVKWAATVFIGLLALNYCLDNQINKITYSLWTVEADNDFYEDEQGNIVITESGEPAVQRRNLAASTATWITCPPGATKEERAVLKCTEAVERPQYGQPGYGGTTRPPLPRTIPLNVPQKEEEQICNYQLKDAEKKKEKKDFGPFFFWHAGMTTEEYNADPPDGYVPKRGIEFNCYKKMDNAMGYVEEWYEKQCNSDIVLVPGTQLMPTGFLMVVYFVFLMYLFIGISIVADIFMESIEVITSKTQEVPVFDKKLNKSFMVAAPVWNPTLANLTLMALGSSAPEILLSVVEVVTTLGEPAGALGPATIVGSAAFNLLVITAVAMVAVGPDPKKPYDAVTNNGTKKVADLGVFFTTAIFSIFAYVWLLIILTATTKDEIDITEAILTFVYFIILLGLAFGADKWNARK